MRSAEFKAALAELYGAGEEPSFISKAPNGFDEVWAIGKCAFIVPVIPGDASPELEYALRLRRGALLTGRCDGCDAVPGSSEVLDGLNVGGVVFPHRRNCPASDENVGPMLEPYQRTWRKRAVESALKQTSAATRDDFARRVSDHGIQITNPAYHEWVDTLMERLLSEEVLDTCPHLMGDPLQTWNTLLGYETWLCNDCWTGMQFAIRSGDFRLPLVEDHTCDRCRRYSGTLAPLAIRMNHFIIRGGLCRQCSMTSVEDSAGGAS